MQSNRNSQRIAGGGVNWYTLGNWLPVSKSKNKSHSIKQLFHSYIYNQKYRIHMETKMFADKNVHSSSVHNYQNWKQHKCFTVEWVNSSLFTNGILYKTVTVNEL